MIRQGHALAQRHRRRRSTRHVPRAPVDRLRHLPVIQIERVAGFEIEAVLSAFGSEPEPIFTAEDVHVRLPLTRADCGPSDPAEAGRVGAADRARHDAPLVRRRNDDLRLAGGIGQHDDVAVLAELGDVGRERSARRNRGATARRQREERNRGGDRCVATFTSRAHRRRYFVSLPGPPTGCSRGTRRSTAGSGGNAACGSV